MSRNRGRGISATLSVLLSLVLVFGPVLANAAPAFASPGTATSEGAPPPVEPLPPGALRELPEKRTEISREYLMADGTTRAEYYAYPIHYRNPQTSRFEPVDVELTEAEIDGREVAVNKKNGFKIQLPERLSGDWVSIEKGSAKASLRPAASGRAADAKVATGTITARSTETTERVYPDAFVGADLAYESRHEGLKETIVVKRPGTGSVFGFDLQLRGLNPRLEEDGSISLVESGETTPTFRIPPPVAWDSSATPESPAAACDAVRYTLTGVAPVWRLEVVVDEAWLVDPGRVYPVSIDPTIEPWVAAPSDTYVSSGYASTNYAYSTSSWLNYHCPSHNWTEWMLIQPGHDAVADMAEKAAEDQEVVGATLKYYLYSPEHGGTVSGQPAVDGTLVGLTSVTWNTRPMQFDYSRQTPSVWPVAGWNTFDTTAMFRHWQDTGAPSDRCTARFAIGEGGHVGFRSAEYGIPSQCPVLTIDYAAVPQVSIVSPEAEGGALTELPLATWEYDEDLPQVEYQVEVSNSPTATAAATGGGLGNATSAALPQPAGGFLPGVTYYVRVRAASSPSAQVPRLWSEWSEGSFTLTVPQPVSSITATTTASEGWFVEDDTDSDGINDARNDTNAVGRGSVCLAWEAATGATGYNVYLSDGNTYREVGSTTGLAWSSAGAGLFPSDSVIATLTPEADPFASGTLELRDDPRPLYAKTAGTAMDGKTCYAFKVVPYNDWGETPSGNAEIEVSLDNRTVGLNDNPRHTSHGLGDLSGHEAVVQLDTGTLELDATDLSIASWGPAAEVARHYSSDETCGGSLAPGWRFGFEQRLVVSGDIAVYVDGTGERHTFLRTPVEPESWTSPNGYFATLEHHEPLLSDDYFTITTKDRSVLRFAEDDGRLESVTDRDGNVVTYAWSAYATDLAITAANGQSIAVDYDAGKVTRATYTTDDGTRQVTYSTDGGVTTVRRFADSDAAYDTRYSYAEGTLASIAVPSVEATWTVGYGSAGTTMTVANTGATESSMRREIALDAGSREATVSTFDGATRYAWNPTGTTALRSAEGSATALTSCTYDAFNLPTGEVSPTVRRTRSVHDARGNVTFEWDEGGRRTAYEYDANDDCVKETDAKGSVVERHFDAHGNVEDESKTLAVSGQKSLTTYTYEYSGDYKGRLLSESAKIDESTSALTDYDYAGSTGGEPTTTTLRGVKLSATASPVDLVSHASYNDFGEVVSETNALGVRTLLNWGFDSAGRITESEDATGVVTHTRYDALGNTIETWRSHETTTTKVDWRLTDYDAASLAVTETSKASDGTTVAVTSREYDDLGREKKSDDSQVPGTARTVYDSQGQATKTFAEGAGTTDGHSTRTQFTAEGEETRSLQPGATAEKFASTTSYTVDGQTDVARNPDGSTVDSDYDEATGELASSTEPTDEGDAETGFEYDLGGRTTETTAPDDSVTTYTYDLLDRQTSVKLGDQTASTTEYNTLGWVLSETDFDGIVKTKTYDAGGRVVSETVGSLTTTHVFDELDREVRRTNPDASSLAYGFDLFGRAVSEVHTGTDSQPARSATTTYDAAGRVHTTYDSVSGLAREFAYGADGRVTITETRGTSSAVSVTDGTGLLHSIDSTIRGADVEWSAETTDMAGRVTEWSALGRSFTLIYDQAGRPFIHEQVNATKDSPPGGSGGGMQSASLPPGEVADGVPAYRYDPATGKKNREAFRFDFAGRTEETTYTYDITGRLKSAELNGTTTSYTYDPTTGALTSYRVGTGPATSLTYGAGGLATVGSRHYTHDSLGRRTASGPQAGSMLASDTFNRANGALAAPWTKTLGSYAVSVQSNAAQSPTPAAAADIWYQNTAVAARADMSVRYTVTQLDAGSGRAFGPIARYAGSNFYFAVLDGGYGAHLHKRYGGAYTLLSAGDLRNSIGRSLRAGDVVALDVFGSALTLTVNGVVVNSATDTSITGAGLPGFRCVGVTGGLVRLDDYKLYSTPATLTDRTYTWSGERLTGYSTPGVGASYVYDGNGQRTTSAVTEAGVTTTTRFAYDGLRLLGLSAERSDDTTWSVDYLYDERGALWGGVYASGATRVPFLAVTTDRGDVRELRTASNGAFAFYSYDPYGNPREVLSQAVTSVDAATAAAIASRQVLRYASYAFDAYSGLYYCSQRYYDPAAGAFISKDSASADSEGSAYQYCTGNPVEAVDPSGLWAWQDHESMTRNWMTVFSGSPNYRNKVARGCADLDNLRWNAAKCRNWHFNGYVQGQVNGLDNLVSVFITVNKTRLGRYIGTPDISEVTFGEGKQDTRREFANARMDSAVKEWKAGRRFSAGYEIGRGMHALQDMWAHGNAYDMAHPIDDAWAAAGAFNKHYDRLTYKPHRVSRTKDISLAYYREFSRRVKQ